MVTIMALHGIRVHPQHDSTQKLLSTEVASLKVRRRQVSRPNMLGPAEKILA